MKYYIIGNKIIGYENALDSTLYDYQALTDAQTLFYEANPGASWNEVVQMKVNPVQLPELADVKAQRIQSYSQQALDIRRAVYDDWQYINAVAGIYDAEKNAKIIAVNKAFRDEYYRLESLVNAAPTIEEIELIENKFDEILNG